MTKKDKKLIEKCLKKYRKEDISNKEKLICELSRAISMSCELILNNNFKGAYNLLSKYNYEKHIDNFKQINSEEEFTNLPSGTELLIQCDGVERKAVILNNKIFIQNGFMFTSQIINQMKDNYVFIFAKIKD